MVQALLDGARTSEPKARAEGIEAWPHFHPCHLSHQHCLCRPLWSHANQWMRMYTLRGLARGLVQFLTKSANHTEPHRCRRPRTVIHSMFSTIFNKIIVKPPSFIMKSHQRP